MANKKIIPIKYTSRDFQSIKNDLVEHAKRYYKDSYKDFNEASFGSLMLDSVAYVGDILSFYLDYQANEVFLDNAVEFENIIKLGRQVGYKYSNAISSTGIATFYISVPSVAGGLAPNMDYAPILKKGSVFSTRSGASFILNEDVRFDNPFNEIRASTVDDNGSPTFYAIKANGSVISGLITSENIAVGAYERFRKIALDQLDIVEILSVVDSEGNEYFETDYLSQNVIYKSFTNQDPNEAVLAKEILKPVLVPRRFVADRNLRSTTLQFGASSDVAIDDNSNFVFEPTNVVLDIYGKNYISSDTFDPSRILNNDKFGIAPSNTVLTITYRYNNSINGVNFAVGALNKVSDVKYEFTNLESLDVDLVDSVESSLEVTNETPLLGDVTNIDAEELKRRIENSFSAQNRAVTEQDYKSLVYSMPPKYGAVKRINVVRDDNSLKRNLNLYVLCQNEEGKLTNANLSVKNNIKTWLNRNKMINDSIDILDGKIINYGISFVALGTTDRSKSDILVDALAQLRLDFSKQPDFGETFMITDIYTSLKKVSGILDVISLTVEPKVGGLYSESQMNFTANTTADGRFINIPRNVVMELKYPESDIKGTIL